MQTATTALKGILHIPDERRDGQLRDPEHLLRPLRREVVARFGMPPAYTGYTSYDDVYIIAEAIQRAGSTDPDKMVTEMEKTDFEGTIGRIQFYGKDDEFTHGIKSGPGAVTGLVFQWQDGKQVTVWPKAIAEGKLKFPDFVKLSQ